MSKGSFGRIQSSFQNLSASTPNVSSRADFSLFIQYIDSFDRFKGSFDRKKDSFEKINGSCGRIQCFFQDLFAPTLNTCPHARVFRSA